MNGRNAKIVLIFYVVSAVIFLSEFFFSTPERNEEAIFVPVQLSIALLVPIYMWYRSYRRKTELNQEIPKRTEGGTHTLLWIITIFLLALSIRIPSVIWFGNPYEKTPLILLIVLIAVLTEKTDLSAFGFKTRNFGKALAHGFVLFAFMYGTLIITVYLLIYTLADTTDYIQYFDFGKALLTMPFMTFCVGISEEGFFRGYAQTHLEKLYSPKTAIFLQATLFGIWHFVWNLRGYDFLGMALYIIATFLFGLVFGYFYNKSRNLMPLIFAHGLWNSVTYGLVESPTMVSTLETLPLSDLLLIWTLPYFVSTAVMFLFVKYVTKEI